MSMFGRHLLQMTAKCSERWSFLRMLLRARAALNRMRIERHKFLLLHYFKRETGSRFCVWCSIAARLIHRMRPRRDCRNRHSRTIWYEKYYADCYSMPASPDALRIRASIFLSLAEHDGVAHGVMIGHWAARLLALVACKAGGPGKDRSDGCGQGDERFIARGQQYLAVEALVGRAPFCRLQAASPHFLQRMPHAGNILAVAP